MLSTTLALKRFNETRDNLYALLIELARIAEERVEKVAQASELGIDQEDPPQRLLAGMLRERAESVRKKRSFRLAVVGEFNIGKSTLINVLLGKPVLSTARQPTTAAVTTLRYGEPERFCVTFLPEYRQHYPTITQESNDLFNDIAKYTSDITQTEDRGIEILQGKEISLAEKIQEVEVWCNSSFLHEQEIEIIDTPGLGSVFEAHKAVTYALIPQVDATLFVSSPDGADNADVAFLKFLREYINQMFFVMTKADFARDNRELEEMLSFNREVIKSAISDIEVKRIYPISSVKALKGRYDESGFPEFIQALQRFLVRSGGVARLKLPLQVARLNWSRLQENVERDIELASNSLSEIQKVREKLEQQSEFAMARKDNLLEYVNGSIENMKHDATHGIDLLSTQLQMVIERQIDAYKWKELLKIDQLIPSLIKEEVDAWLSDKDKRFNNQIELLKQRIDGDLRSILEDIRNISSASHQRSQNDIATPQINGVFTQGMLQSTNTMIINTGVSFATGLTLSGFLWGIAVSTAISTAPASAIIAPPLVVLIPLLVSARRLLQETMGFRQTLRNNVKNALKRNMPNNTRNVYQAVIEGYVDDSGTLRLGMREIVNNAFRSWGDELKTNVRSVVISSLDDYKQRLAKRISVEEKGQWNQESELKKLHSQHEALLIAEKRLIELEAIVGNLAADEQEEDAV